MPKKASEIPLEQNKLILLVGPADSGKSYSASSWGFKSKSFGGDDERPAYLMDTDGRLDALRNRPIEYDSYTNVEGAIGVINRLKELRDKCVHWNKAPFHTLIAPDSFTGFCSLAISDCMEDKTSAGRKIGDLTLPTIEDYGYESEAVRKLLWELLTDLKKFCTIIVTAHEVEKYKKIKAAPGAPAQTELDGYKILARDKISAQIPVKFDEIYHFLPKEVVTSQKTIRRSVVFQDELARTSYPQLAKLGTTAQDISGKEFYHWWKEKISG